MAPRFRVLGRLGIPLLAVGLFALASCSDTNSSGPDVTGGMKQGGAPSSGAGQHSMGGTTAAGTAGTAGDNVDSGGSPGAGRGGATAGHGGEVVQGGASGAPSGMAGVAGSDPNGGSGSGENCRLFASSYTVTGSASFVMLSCTFDRAALTMECSSDRGDVTVTSWNTLGDAVGEYRPIGLRRAARSEETLGSGECRVSRDFRYDGAGRLTAVEVTIDPNTPCGTNGAIYDAWDSSGRPTHGVENGVGSETCAGGDVSFVYDDVARTITTTRTGGTDCPASTTILNHDTDGLRTTAVNGKSGVVSSTYQTLTTAEICE